MADIKSFFMLLHRLCMPIMLKFFFLSLSPSFSSSLDIFLSINLRRTLLVRLKVYALKMFPTLDFSISTRKNYNRYRSSTIFTIFTMRWLKLASRYIYNKLPCNRNAAQFSQFETIWFRVSRGKISRDTWNICRPSKSKFSPDRLRK